MTTAARPAPIRAAEILAVGSEITTGDTRDTNGGELARELTDMGVEVVRIVALRDDLPSAIEAVAGALAHVDLLVTTGGLGPTPDDLTREAIAGALGETPAVNDDLERELRALFERRGIAMPERNRKQAWLIPSASALPNPNGTAPGWWVEAGGGRVIAALPGPPREMRPMWREHVIPRLRARGLGADRATAVLRLAGIGESHVAELVGDALLGGANPSVATYARADAVDLRIVTRADGRTSAADLLGATLAELEPRLGPHVFARDGETWVDALARRLGRRTVAVTERGTGGSVTALVGGAPWLRRAVSENAEHDAGSRDVGALASEAVSSAGADLGVAVAVAERAGDSRVEIGIADAGGSTTRTRTAFLGGEEGRRRAAVLTCLELWRWLGGDRRD